MSKTPTTLIMAGIPGSGKSTLAKEMIKNDPSYVRVNRDDLRFMLMDLPMLPGKLEGKLTEICNEMIVSLLSSGHNVIVDNTHCTKKYMDELVELVKPYSQVQFKLVDIDLNDAIDRDNDRERKVGNKVIRRMHANLSEWKNSFDWNQVIPKEQFRKMPEFKLNEKSIAILVDIDGTLAHMHNRGPFDWMSVGQDNPVNQVINVINSIKESNETINIIALSGRDEICREITERWLIDHGVRFDSLLMRKRNDFRKDSLIKKEIYETTIKSNYNVMAVFDDRDQVVKMWRSLGLYVFNCDQSGIKF